MKQTGQIVQSEVLLHFSGDFCSFFFFKGHSFFEEHFGCCICCTQDLVLHELFASNGKVAVSVRKTVKGTSNMNARDLIVEQSKDKKYFKLYSYCSVFMMSGGIMIKDQSLQN